LGYGSCPPLYNAYDETLDSKRCKDEKERWEMIDSSYWEMMNPFEG